MPKCTTRYDWQAIVKFIMAGGPFTVTALSIKLNVCNATISHWRSGRFNPQPQNCRSLRELAQSLGMADLPMGESTQVWDAIAYLDPDTRGE